MWKMTHRGILALWFFVTPSLGFYSFQSKIPNGASVSHPCKANYMWRGVGHLNPAGGGERNAFGKDFHNAGNKWTKDLCRFDSDGDGKTNGEELGDPKCVWTEGSVPERVKGITHPGVCNPYGKGICKGRDTFVDCSIESFGDSCDVIKEPDIQTIDLKFKQHTIPATETNYYCQYFDLPSTQDLHLVANEGLIDNREVLHHMVLYGCPDDYKGSPIDDSPNPCSMSGGKDSCTSIISLWTVGLPGTCYGADIGFRIGLRGFKKVKLEIHYNNPMLVAGYTDQTGLRLFYRKALSHVQDLATFMVGQNLLEIPPGQAMVEARGSCPSDCTKRIITKNMQVISTINHMHYLGRSQRTEVIRNGRVVKALADDKRYAYDSPKFHWESEPFEVFPGDEIATTCRYSSMSKKQYVFFGEDTSAEMCYAFLTVYPADALTEKFCLSDGPLSVCDYQTGAPKHGCDWKRFTNLSDPEMTEHYSKLKSRCNLDGLCRPECKELVGGMLKHPCLQKEMNSVVSQWLQYNKEGLDFLGRIHSCSGYIRSRDDKDKDCPLDCSKCHVNVGDGEGHSNAGAPLTSLVVVMAMPMLLTAAVLF